MFKTKVMEDLDALLADLQSTTSHISSYQQQQQQHQLVTSPEDAESRESTPPPLPPPPSQDVLSEVSDQPLYEAQQVKHQYHSNVSNTAVTRSHSTTHQGPPPASFTAPPPPSHPPPPVSSTSPTSSCSPATSMPPRPAPKPLNKPRVQPKPEVHPKPDPKPEPPKPSSMLSSNLSELDMLLQDLSSAQFMAEVDRRNAANMSNHGASDMAMVVPPAAGTSGGERTVDSLLIELENSATPPSSRPRMSSHPSVESMSSHYEAVRPRLPNVAVSSGPSQSVLQQNPPRYQAAASTATRELDDLMASLSDFKVSGQQVPQVQQLGPSPYAQPQKLQKPQVSGQPALQRVGEPLYAQPHKLAKSSHQQPAVNNPQTTAGGGSVDGLSAAPPGGENHLETMLGTLSTDMSRQGIMTIPKGHCAACAKPIVGQVITALGRIWHPEHFTCSHCKEELGTRNFFERDGVPYCERDYHNLFSPRCTYCNGPILDKCVTALDKTWHPEHFFCAKCGRLFGDDGFHEKDGSAYCRDDYFELFAPKCGGCVRPIMDNYISALNRQWHPECFICTDCRTPFGGGSFFDHEGMPYCETHYHAKRGSLCAGCMKPITGRCITAMYKKFHPEHFVCAFCLKQLNKGTFKEQNEKPYCHPCFVKLFG